MDNKVHRLARQRRIEAMVRYQDRWLRLLKRFDHVNHFAGRALVNAGTGMHADNQSMVPKVDRASHGTLRPIEE